MWMSLCPFHWLWRLSRWKRDIVSIYVNFDPKKKTVSDNRRLKYNSVFPELKVLKIDNNLVTVSELSYYEGQICHTT